MFVTLLTVQYITCVILFIECVFVFVNWRTRLQSLLFLSCIATLINNCGYLMVMLSKSKEEILHANMMAYVGKVWISFSLFVFVLHLCKKQLQTWMYIVLAGFHFFILGLVVTGEYHNLYYTTETFVEDGIFPHVDVGFGPFYIIFALVMVTYMIIGLTLLIVTIHREKDPLAKKKLFIFTSAMAVECLFYGLQMTGMADYYDATALGYTIGSIILGVGLLKYDLMNVRHLARDFIIDELAEGIILVDKSGEVDFYNKPAYICFPDLKWDEKAVLEQIKEAAKSKTVIEINDRLYIVEELPLLIKNEEQGTIYAIIDDTEHHLYMEQLREQVQIANQANDSKSAFLSVVSHEIRTPMNAIVGMTDILLRDAETDKETKLSDKQKNYLRNIKTSGSSLVMIVNDILDQSKIEAGKMELVNAPYEIRAMVEDVRLIIENRVGNKPIQVQTEIDEMIPKFVTGDSLRLRQILINIMNNAVKFTDAGFIKLSIRLTSTRNDKYLIHFSIKDSGQGIKPEDQEKLGQAFTQVDQERNHNVEGTGLGLAISKKFIEMMGGKLELYSEYGVGTEFFFTIHQEIAENATDFICPNARLLIVDDTDINILVARELLAPSQIQIDEALSGEEAIELISKNEYDLVFIDYMMPHMDGVETTKKIREFSSVPIIAVSGDTTEETRHLFREAGMDDYLDKPIEAERVKLIFKKWLSSDKILKKNNY